MIGEAHGSAKQTVTLRLVGGAKNKAGEGEQVTGVLRSHNRHGLIVELNSPFIDGHHIMMSMPDGLSCQLDVAFPDNDMPGKRAEVQRFNKEKKESMDGFLFVVELGYLPENSGTPRSKIWGPFLRKAGQLIRNGENI